MVGADQLAEILLYDGNSYSILNGILVRRSGLRLLTQALWDMHSVFSF